MMNFSPQAPDQSIFLTVNMKGKVTSTVISPRKEWSSSHQNIDYAGNDKTSDDPNNPPPSSLELGDRPKQRESKSISKTVNHCKTNVVYVHLALFMGDVL